MSDIADDADGPAEAFNKAALCQKKPEGPKYTGFCANCGEALAPPLRWCDKACMDDEQARLGRTNANR